MYVFGELETPLTTENCLGILKILKICERSNHSMITFEAQKAFEARKCRCTSIIDIIVEFILSVDVFQEHNIHI